MKGGFIGLVGRLYKKEQLIKYSTHQIQSRRISLSCPGPTPWELITKITGLLYTKKEVERVLCCLDMGRSPCCSKEGLNRGAWTAMEDRILKDYIKIHGDGQWRNLPKRAGERAFGLGLNFELI